MRKGDQVRLLPPRGSTGRGDQRLWRVTAISGTGDARRAALEEAGADVPETREAALADLVVVAAFRDLIYPGLVSTGKVERGGDRPFHTVINGENYLALRALTYTHRGKIDAIYIDPPYNTGAKDWKYNNDFVEADDAYRHSKWLAMMERRLRLARELLNPDNSVLIVTIDEKEYLRLGLLLEQTFADARIQMTSSMVNPANVARPGGFGRNDEYLFFAMFGRAAPEKLLLSRDWVSSKGRTHTGNIRWDLLRRSGTNAARTDRPGLFYPIYIDPAVPRIAQVGDPLPQGTSASEEIEGLVALLPIRRNGTEGNWQWYPDTLRKRIAEGRVRIGGSLEKGFVIYILKNGEYGKIQREEFKVIGKETDGSLVVEQKDATLVRAIPGTQWRISSHDATQYGSRLLGDIMSARRFPFPKSLYAVEDSLRFFIANKPNATILDFFAGSGTTAHAVMRLNRQDGGRRRCILVTNNEVGADEQKALRQQGLRPGDPEWEQWGICEHITKPRVRAAITGLTPDGEPIPGDYKFTDEFPMAEGFAENAEFFTLTFESPVAVDHNLAFARIAPLLWLRAGSEGRRIDALPDAGFALADTYALLADLDAAAPFCAAVAAAPGLRIAYIVTDDPGRFQAVARCLPAGVEPLRLYESYLTNFQFANGD
ncbi:site-specific DNA-methyltransferase [Thiohalocapsa sp. ML1]|uniref:site-specific DNA-methyltransferase n=1 Tax=Thiohalocapsa sp. ML1 TaxID=1431688 RepID=UPI0020B1594F|nr:DNA methyltransferase [Thiohalocapsa sp. ML1]